MKRLLLTLVLLSAPQHAQAQHVYVNAGVPTKVGLAHDGILVFGNFGDPKSCGKSNVAFLPGNASEDIKDRVMSMIMTAISAQKVISFWSSGCVAVPWYYGSTANVSEFSVHGIEFR